MEREDVQVRPGVSIKREKKIMVVGHKGCGKTCLIASFMTESPANFESMPKETRRTIYFGSEWVPVVLCEGESNPQYVVTRMVEYTGTSAALVCFSFNDLQSMRSVPQWIDEVRTRCPSADLLVVGCKLDLKDQMPISATEWTCIEETITPYNYMECSARTGEGVPHLVRVVGNALLNQRRSENASSDSVVQH